MAAAWQQSAKDAAQALVARLGDLDPRIMAGFGGLVALWLVWRLLRWHRRYLSWRHESAEAQRARRAAQAETDAMVLLRDHGYRIVESQLEHQWPVYVDGEPLTINIRADFMVARRGKRYIAEVKSGNMAPSITTAATRRQLLEYSLAYPVDGVLLVDMEALTICEVEFALDHAQQRASSRGRWWVGFALGLLAGMGLMRWLAAA